MSGLLAFGLQGHPWFTSASAQTRMLLSTYFTGTSSEKNCYVPDLSGLNWRREERSAEGTRQCLYDLMAARSDLVT